MLRFVLLIAVLFAAPFIAHALWRLVATRPAGQDAQERAGDAPAPLGLLALIGAGLSLLAVVLLTVFAGGDSAREGAFNPPRLEGGRVVPGEIGEAEPDSARPEDDEAPGEPPARR
ncbi:hypothetical protein E5163_14235 [Marinicauda algicola]|uniref:Uncharacterized protein n=1 Tax=Marinicauda algicola TaxID=2029849 RepID=A0A4S2GXK8_9PROT|nr:hypothetical protein [Marinicauda algicola]TGY87591.1 hypothetical protein E5163_14235 [Marinicauda algicola]